MKTFLSEKPMSLRQMLNLLGAGIALLATGVKVSPDEITKAIYRAGRGEHLAPAEREFFGSDGKTSKATRFLVQSWSIDPERNHRDDAVELLRLIALHDHAVDIAKAPNVSEREIARD